MNDLRFSITDAAGANVVAGQAGVAAAAPGKPPASGGGFENMIFLMGIVFVFIFLMILPQRRKDKQRRQMLADIARGDKVVTAGGIHGEISQLGEDDLILIVDAQKGTTLKMSRSAISRVVTDEDVSDRDRS